MPLGSSNSVLCMTELRGSDKFNMRIKEGEEEVKGIVLCRYSQGRLEKR